MLEPRPIVLAGVGAALVGVMQQAGLRAPRRFNAISSALNVRWRSLTALSAQPTMKREIQVEDRRQIQLGAAPNHELGRVADPALIRPRRRELPREHIGGDRLIVLAHGRGRNRLRARARRPSSRIRPPDALLADVHAGCSCRSFQHPRPAVAAPAARERRAASARAAGDHARMQGLGRACQA